MSTIRVTVPDEIIHRIHDAFASQYGRPDEIPDDDNPGAMVPNPETKEQFTERMVARFVEEVTHAYETNKAAEDAREIAATKAKNEINLSTQQGE